MSAETYESAGILCPACNYLDEDAWEICYDPEWNCVVSCPNCEAQLSVSKTTKVTYTARLSENKEASA